MRKISNFLTPYVERSQLFHSFTLDRSKKVLYEGFPGSEVDKNAMLVCRAYFTWRFGIRASGAKMKIGSYCKALEVAEIDVKIEKIVHGIPRRFEREFTLRVASRTNIIRASVYLSERVRCLHLLLSKYSSCL